MDERVTAMPSQPWEGVYAARSSDGVVALDVSSDAYFCIYDPVLDDSDRAPALLSALLSGQGITATITMGPSRPTPDDAHGWQEMPDMGRPAVRLIDAWRFLRSLIRASILFRLCSFAGLLARAGSHAAHCECPDPHEVALAVTRFLRLSLWLPFRMQCLFRSAFLLDFLRAYDLGADWMFGATLFPFHAHCWLAAGDMLLGEQPHRIDRLSLLLVRPATGA